MNFWKNIFCLAILSVLTWLHANAQGSKADSMFKAILSQPADTNQINALNDLGIPYELTDSAFADKAYRKALDLSRKLKNPKLECKTLTNLGILCKNHKNFSLATHYQLLSFQVAKRAGLSLEAGKALSNLANVQMFQNQFSKAMATFLEAIKFLEKARDQRLLSLTLNNISYLYAQQNQYHLEIKYAEKALVAGKLANNANAIGSAYANASHGLYCLDLLDSSYSQALRAIPFLKQAGNNPALQSVYQNASSYHLTRTKNLDLAEAYSDSSLTLARLYAQKSLQFAIPLAASVVIEKKELAKARKLLDEAKPIIEGSQNLRAKADFEKTLARYHKASGNWKQAFEHKERQFKWQDLLNITGEKQRTSELEVRYETAKKQVQIKQLELSRKANELTIQRRNYWIGGLAIAAFFIGIIAFLIYQNANRKQRIARQTAEIQQQKIRELEQERQIVATQSVLKGQDEERSRLARDLHDGLGGMLSGLKFSMNNMKGNMILDEENAIAFSNSIGQLDKVINEMRRVAHSLMPEALVRFGLKEATQDLCDQVAKTSGLKVHFQAIGMEDELEKSVSVALYRIEQELLNNILKHAEATEITVQLVKDESQISLTVEDNGKGFDPTTVRTGAGLSSIQTRVEALGGKLDVQSKPGDGTSILIEVNT